MKNPHSLEKPAATLIAAGHAAGGHGPAHGRPRCGRDHAEPIRIHIRHRHRNGRQGPDKHAHHLDADGRHPHGRRQGHAHPARRTDHARVRQAPRQCQRAGIRRHRHPADPRRRGRGASQPRRDHGNRHPDRRSEGRPPRRSRARHLDHGHGDHAERRHPVHPEGRRMAGILRAHARPEGRQRATREEHRPVRRVQTRDHLGRTHIA